MKILANDGLEESGVKALQKKGFEVFTNKIEQNRIIDFINENEIEVLLVRSATQVKKEVIDGCPSLKIIGRGGIGMDNIDVSYAREKGIPVINTPGASSISVAELVFAHLFSGARYLQESNREMPALGNLEFAKLKKNYAKGTELKGKTIGIIGFGKIGQEVAKIALGLGMKVMATDQVIDKVDINIEFYNGQSIAFEIKTESMENVLKNADFITLHVPAQKEGYLIAKEQFDLMKQGAAIINCARGGVIDEDALLNALNQKHLAFAGLDVYTEEPTPNKVILNHPKISLSPHIGAATMEAQERVAASLVEQISSYYNK